MLLRMIKMKYLMFTCLFFIVACVGLGHLGASESPSLRRPARNQETKLLHEEPKQLNDIYVDHDRLSYRGYDVLKLRKTVKYEYPSEIGEKKSSPVEVSYAVVRKGNRTLAKFEGVYFIEGNATEFGLFSLLGRESKELIVSQTIPRGGRHWVVSFSPEYQLLFDSADYGVGREEFSVVDIDKDGVYELVLPVTAFYMMQDKMYIGEIPLPDIIFKYDLRVNKFVPANSIFRDYALHAIEADVKNLTGPTEGNYLSKRLSIFLRYIYAGKDEEAWAFFDREYRLPDKEEMKSRIQAILKDEDVYKYLHR